MGLIKRNIHMDGCRHENKTISLDQLPYDHFGIRLHIRNIIILIQ